MVQDFVPMAKFEGEFEGEHFSIPRTICGHTLTDDEMDQLERGETIHFDATSQKGNSFVAVGALGEREYRGKREIGFVFRDVPYNWGSHVFTDDEVKRLEAGEKVHLADCRCDVTLGKENGRPHLVVQRDPSEYCEGTFEGRQVHFKRVFRGKKLTDEQCQELLAGKTTIVKGIKKKDGSTYDAEVGLGDVEFDDRETGEHVKYFGVKFVGLCPKRDPSMYCEGTFKGRKVHFKRMFRGKKLSDEQCQELLAGGTTVINGLKARNGSTYDAEVGLGDVEFDDRETGEHVKYFGVRFVGFAR